MSSFGQAQYSTKSKKAIKLYEEADLLLKQRRFSEAVRKFNTSLEKDNDFIEAHLRLAYTYDVLRAPKKQQYHLEQVLRIAPGSARYKNVYYLLGKVYFNQGRYKESGILLDQLGRLGIDNKKMKDDVEALQKNIEFALENMKTPINISPKPMPGVINSFPLQYFPVLTADEQAIIYTTRDGVTIHDDEDIVISFKDDEGNWQKPLSISPNINSQFNEGTCTISADGRTLIFTNCEGRQGFGSCDLYFSQKTGEEWSVPENLGPNINSRAWESQPSLSADGRKLFFISDRAGGMGKRDIWMSVKDKNNEWTRAVNLGSVINTEEDEVSPFIHVNGTTLFFASNGLPGFGGYDLYKSEWRDSTWSEPENLGYPLNTHEDQVSLFVSTNGKNGYYSYERTNEAGQKMSLLYQFQFPESGILENKTVYLTGYVFDKETNEPLGATIELYELGSDEPFSIFDSDPVNGKYYSILSENINLSLYIDAPGYLFENQLFDISDASGDEIRRDIYLTPIRKGGNVRLSNIFFEFNSASLTENSKTELMKVHDFLTSNPTVRILIEGHTDDQGTEEYNLALSERRAKAVYDFLIGLGIEKKSLSYVGYGESRPLEQNIDERSRSINRRIEFSVESLDNMN